MLNTWRDEILKIFREPMPVLSFVADSEGLLDDKLIRVALEQKKIEYIEYSDPIVFRYIYETKYREPIQTKSKHLIIITKSEGFESIPFDLLIKGEKYSISKSSIFPKFSPTIIKALPVDTLEDLYSYYQQYNNSNSDHDTIEFILEKVYNIQYNCINSLTDLIKLLYIKHSTNKYYPEILENYLIGKLGQIKVSKKLPLTDLIISKDFFIAYLQREWKLFIDFLESNNALVNEATSYLENKEAINFFNEDLRLIISGLFTEGKLNPINVKSVDNFPKWVRVGISFDYMENSKARLLESIMHLSERIDTCINYREWIDCAFIYSEIWARYVSDLEDNDEEINEFITQLQLQIDRHFETWIEESFDTLINLPYLPNPVMLQHIPHFLASKLDSKIALIVLDCMSMMQWSQISRRLKDIFEYEQQGVYAWIPTITSVSRQSIFAGEKPIVFSNSINGTSKESNHWKYFWHEHGIINRYVDYQKITNTSTQTVETIELSPTNKVLAIVIDTIDELAHNATQGYKGLHAEMKVWMDKGYLVNLIDKLITENYQIYLTSDHGNKQCVGVGKISDGSLAYTRGERVRLYDSEVLRDKAAKKYQATTWKSAGLPNDMYMLIAQNKDAFVSNDQIVVSHGGKSIEEVIVPFIKILGKKVER